MDADKIPLTPELLILHNELAEATTRKVPEPVTRKVSQMLLIDGQYFWAHPEVAATLAAFFDPDSGQLAEGYTEEDFQDYVEKNKASRKLQPYGYYGDLSR